MSKQNSPDAPAPEAASVAPANPAKTPDEWEKSIPAARGGAGSHALAQHRAAAQLHGWGLHAYHEREPMRLTRDVYTQALACCEPPKPTKDNLRPEPVPFKAAMSPHAPYAVARKKDA